MTAPDILGSAEPLDSSRPPRRQPRRPRGSGRATSAVSGWVVGLLAAAIVGSLSTGIVAATALGGGGPQPEDVLPGDAFLFLKVDFDPAASQKLAVRNLAGRVPDAPAEQLTGLRDALLRSVLDDEDSTLDFERDLEPWLGDRVGVAAFAREDEEPGFVVAVQTTDADRTRRVVASLAERGEEVVVAFRRGYALLSEDQEMLDQALTRADAESLAESEQYAEDRGHIAGDQIAVGWVDNGELLDEGFRTSFGEDDVDQLNATDEPAGRTIAGIRATRDYAELELLTLDGPSTQGAGHPTTLERLPASTAVAAYAYNLGGLAEDLAEALGPLASLTGPLFEAFVMPYGSEASLDDDAVFEVEEGTASGTFAPVPVPCITGPEPAPSPAPEAHYCYEFPDDQVIHPPVPPFVRGLRAAEEVLPLLADETTVALGDLAADDLGLGIVTRVAGPGNAVAPLTAMLTAFGFEGATVRTSDGLVYAAPSAAGADALATGGTLGDEDRFGLAMGELDDRVSMAVYADLTEVAGSVEDYPEELAGLTAVGLVVTDEGTVQRLRLRLVAEG